MTIKQPLKYIALVLTLSVIVYLMFTSGVFKIYAHLFGENHLHRQNTRFRLWFIAIFSLVNYFYFVPRFYIQKRYAVFFSILMFCLVSMLILPEFVIKQPVFEPPKFENNVPFLPIFSSPIPLPLFEMVNMIVLFSISTFVSMAIRTQQSLASIEAQNVPIEPYFEAKNNIIVENSPETALTVTVNYSLVRIDYSDILYIKSMDNYLHFNLKDKKPILVRMTLKEAETKLPNSAFMRVHKSYIVAMAAIESIRNKTILIAQQDIPIGRVYEEAVFKIFEK